jgi:hypothetical protein
MSLGNVSCSRRGMVSFRQAIEYLRSASHLPNYELPEHLQQYVSSGILTLGLFLSVAYKSQISRRFWTIGGLNAKC